MQYLFVYGTLRRHFANPFSAKLIGHSHYISTGFMQGRLYDIAGYPGAIEATDTGNWVLGDVYQLTDPSWLLPQLDDYEECTDCFPAPHEYIRKSLMITLPNHRHISSWAYIYNKDVSDLRRIRSGDYVSYHTCQSGKNSLTR